MNKKIITQTILTGAVVVALFFILFDLFGMEWLYAGLLAFILGEILVLVPLYILFWRELRK